MTTTAPTRPRRYPPATDRSGQRTEIVRFAALDGRPLSLLHVTDSRHPVTRGPVLLVHGAGVRAEIFRPPLPRTLVDALLEDGFDVWMLNWRASIDLEPVAWTLDDAAAYDHPAAVRTVLEATGASSLKAFVHCQGSTSFVMSAIAGLVPGVETIVTNAVSLHTTIPAFAVAKIIGLTPLINPLTATLSPRWGYRSQGRFSRAVTAAVRATHPECDNTVCRMVSFTYGSGRPALWAHRNIDRATHDWIVGEFSGAPISFFLQMRESVKAGHLVSTGKIADLPADFAAITPRTDARFSFIAGADNRCFLASSQRRSYEHFKRTRPGADHTLHVVPGYGHLDVVFGADAWQDTHPIILEELRR